MARSVRSLILLAGCAAFAGWGVEAFAEPQTGQANPAANNPAKKERRKDQEPTPAPASPEFENVRKALDALTPEQRKRFQENFIRWANLSPVEKKALQDREEMRKKVMEQDVQAAIQESGLQLEGEKREQFILRYTEERKKIEEQLRKEMMEKRKPQVKELIARLKAEFSGGSITPVEVAPVR